jgi:hypothetical protein
VSKARKQTRNHGIDDGHSGNRQRQAQQRGSSALLLSAAVGVLALPSAVLAVSSTADVQADSPAPTQLAGGFTPSEVDPRLGRSITVRALSKGRLFRFTPAATPSQLESAVITVAVRLPANRAGLAVHTSAPSIDVAPAGLRIAPTAYSLGTARGYRSFAENLGTGDIRKLEMPDLASYQPRGEAGKGDSSRFAPRVVLDESETAGRSPRTFEQNDQTVDLGGSYRVGRNLNVTAGVRYQSERDRLVPLTDGNQDSQAVYVGTQFRF